MIYLVFGVVLWSSAHLFKSAAPTQRAAAGDAGRAGVAVAVLISIVLMIIGYQQASGPLFWGRSATMVGLNNLLMLLAIYFMVISVIKVKLNTKVRHPQLTAIKTWAIAHLLVNGDVASFVLFGGLLAWAVVSVILIGKQDGKADVNITSSATKELGAIALTLALYGAVSAAHTSLGYPVFG